MFFSCYNAQNEKHEHTCSMVAMSCNFLMKLILWVNFDVTGNQYEQEKVFYHIQMMECSRLCKKIGGVTEIYFYEIVDNKWLSYFDAFGSWFMVASLLNNWNLN